MNSQRWRRLEELLDAALDLPPPDRASFLRREYADAPDLAARVSGACRFDGGAPRLLVRLDDPRRTAPRPEFTGDGRRIYVMLTEREADIRTVRLEDRRLARLGPSVVPVRMSGSLPRLGDFTEYRLSTPERE